MESVMKICALLSLALVAASVSACVVEADHYGRPGYRGQAGTVVEYNHYDDRDRNYHSDHYNRDHWHCPPGQAKKGNC